jgi:hypothetical protein
VSFIMIAALTYKGCHKAPYACIQLVGQML